MASTAYWSHLVLLSRVDNNNIFEDFCMARRFGFFTVVPLVLMTATVFADEEQPAEQKPQTYSEKVHGYIAQMKPVSTYVGVGLFDDMVHVNVETVTDMGNFYARVGKFIEADANMAANVGWRYPITGTRDEEGYFMGFFIGHVIASSFAEKDHNRSGAGAEMSYHWVTEHTRKVISVGLGTGFSDRVDPKSKEVAAPRIFIGFSTALKVF
jgi:hypothetical protein